MQSENVCSVELDFANLQMRTSTLSSPQLRIDITVATNSINLQMRDAIVKKTSTPIRSSITIKPQDIFDISVKFEDYETEQMRQRKFLDECLSMIDDLEQQVTLKFTVSKDYALLLRKSPEFKKYLFKNMSEFITIQPEHHFPVQKNKHTDKKKKQQQQNNQPCICFKAKVSNKVDFTKLVTDGLKEVGCFGLHELSEQNINYIKRHCSKVENFVFDQSSIYLYSRNTLELGGCLRFASQLEMNSINLVDIFRPEAKLRILQESTLLDELITSEAPKLQVQIQKQASRLKIFGPVVGIQKFEFLLHQLCQKLNFRGLEWKGGQAYYAVAEQFKSELISSQGLNNVSQISQVSSVTSNSKQSSLSSKSKASKYTPPVKHPVYVDIQSKQFAGSKLICIGLCSVHSATLLRAYEQFVKRLEDVVHEAVNLQGNILNDCFIQQLTHVEGVCVETDSQWVYFSGPKGKVQEVKAILQTKLIQVAYNSILREQKNLNKRKLEQQKQKKVWYNFVRVSKQIQDEIRQEFASKIQEGSTTQAPSLITQGTTKNSKMSLIKLRGSSINELVKTKAQILKYIVTKCQTRPNRISTHFWTEGTGPVCHINLATISLKQMDYIHKLTDSNFKGLIRKAARVQHPRQRFQKPDKDTKPLSGFVLTPFPYSEAASLLAKEDYAWWFAELREETQQLGWLVFKRLNKFYDRETVLVCEYFGKSVRNREWCHNSKGIRVIYLLQIWTNPCTIQSN